MGQGNAAMRGWAFPVQGWQSQDPLVNWHANRPELICGLRVNEIRIMTATLRLRVSLQVDDEDDRTIYGVSEQGINQQSCSTTIIDTVSLRNRLEVVRR